MSLTMEFLNKFKLLITMGGGGETFLTIREPMLPFASKSVFFSSQKSEEKTHQSFTMYVLALVCRLHSKGTNSDLSLQLARGKSGEMEIRVQPSSEGAS